MGVRSFAHGLALAIGTAALAASPYVAHAASGQTPTPPPPTSANSVNLFLHAGDARALATCLNIARHNQGALQQNNRCQNVVQAKGGDLVILGADISAIQTNEATVGNPANSNVALTAQAGSATAIATCVNSATGSNTHVHQANHCFNVAIATGGNIVLVNVNVTGVQLG